MSVLWLSAWLWAASDTARPPVQVTAEKLQVFSKENRAVYSGRARAVRTSTTLDCDTLTVFYENESIVRIEAVGHVEARDGTRLAKGERADFDNVTGVLVLTGNPEAHDGPTHVAGSRVTLTVGKEQVDVEDAQTLMEKAPAGGKNVLIQSPRLSFFGKSRRAVWTGRVRATRQEAVIVADKLIAYYGADDTLSRAEAFNHVEVTEKNRWAAGDFAEFNQKTGVLVLTGNPRARQGGTSLKGTKVTFTLGRDLLEVENAESVFESEEAIGGKRK